jgi:hypothetical protein
MSDTRSFEERNPGYRNLLGKFGDAIGLFIGVPTK